MNILCSIIADVLHVMGIIFICKDYLKLIEKTGNKYRYIKVLIISVIGSLIIDVMDNLTIAVIIYLLCVGIMLHVCFFEKTKKLLICTLWISMIVELIEMIWMPLVDIASTFMGYDNEPLENVIVALLSIGFISCVGVLLKKITDEGIRNISIKYLIFFTINLFANFCILVLMTGMTLEEQVYSTRFAYIIICIAVTVGLCVEMAAVMLLLISRDRYKEKEFVIKQYLEEQVKQYEYLNDREQETKKFRHDIRGHLYFLNKLKRERKDKEFEQYFQDLIGKVDDLDNCINVGNDIVNAVLNKTYAEAKSKHIKMNVTGHFPTQCQISAYHLCTIFFNLLNNAIEAAEKADKKELWVICQYTKKEIIIEIGNYYCDNLQIHKDKLQTTKSQKQYHGWGMKNVQDSVTNCKGLMDIDVVEDKFIVSITLNNDKEDMSK